MKYADQKNEHSDGFTVMELVIVIAVIGVLVALVLVNLSGWKQSTTETQLKSDLNSAAAAMEDARNKGNGYPSGLPSSFTASKGVSVVYTSGSASNYCINATDTATGNVKFYIASSGGVPAPKAGSC